MALLASFTCSPVPATHPLMSKHPTIEDKLNLTPSILKCIKEDYEDETTTVQQTANQWNMEFDQLRIIAKRHNWLTKTNRIKLQNDLEASPKLLKKLSNPNNQCHQELSKAEKLVVRKAKLAVTFQDTILDIGMEALENVKRDGLEIRSAFDLEKVNAVMSQHLGLNEASSADATVNVNFTNSRSKPEIIVDVD
jgi:hypothetical protein